MKDVHLKLHRRLSDLILEQAATLEPASSLTAKDIEPFATRGAIDHALSRLAKRGSLERIRRGEYVLGENA
jgi:predicted transcriptional regulator of viral defense system